MSELGYTIVSRPSIPHECITEKLEKTARGDGWKSWTVIECEECGKQWYWMEHETRRRHYFYKIGWWNSWLVDWHNR